jgi:hypothetical protein
MKAVAITFDIIKAILFLVSVPFRLVHYVYVRYFTFYDNWGRWKKDFLLVIMYNIMAFLFILLAIGVFCKYLVG